MEVNGGETWLLHEVFILDWIRKLVFIVFFGMTLEYLIAKLFHDVEIRGVNELSGNNLKAFDARYLDYFLVENMNVVVRHDDETVLFYVLFLLLVTHKCEEYNVFFFQDFYALLLIQQVNCTTFA